MELNNQPLDLTNAVVAQTDTIALDESLIRKSRNATNYRIENQNGDPVSLYTRKTLTFAFMQVKKEDNQFYDFYVDLDELAKAINVLPRNLKAYLDLKGENGKDVLNELYNSSMVFQELNENEDEFNPQVFKIHLMSCSMRIGNRVYFRFDDSMKKILLEIGNANNPYYSFIANQSLSLNSTSAMDLFELIENELTLLEYKTTTNTKWKELRLSIKLLRKITFTENKYKNTNVFVYTFLVRCLKNISEVTNTEIDLKSIKTDMPGTKATIVIMKVRHKKVPYIHNNNKYLLDEETGVRFYDDAELNECFGDFYRTLNLSYSEDDINNWKNHLKKCVDESLGEETETLNIDIALKILRKSIRKKYKDFIRRYN